MARFRFRYLSLAAAAVLPSAGHATVYMTPEQAQGALYPHQALRQDFRTFMPEQISAIRKASGESPLSKQLKAWRAADGGWFIIDEVVGKHEFITYAVSLDSAGAVRDVEILEYREAYGSQVRDPHWRQQFVGKRSGQSLKLGSDIKNISGATLSSKHVTDGVRRILATHAIVLARG